METRTVALHSKLRGVVGVALASMFVSVGPAWGQDQSLATTIESSELASRIDDGTAPFVLDVRTPAEYAEGHIAGAVNIPHTELADRLSELEFETSEEIVVYCRTGRRARVAEAILAEAGYTGVRDLQGHIQGWRAAELPLETSAESSDHEENEQ
ncbi:MAG: rhodanese-like domain-containing protein [Gemmatimonadota bacterium]